MWFCFVSQIYISLIPPSFRSPMYGNLTMLNFSFIKYVVTLYLLKIQPIHTLKTGANSPDS